MKSRGRSMELRQKRDRKSSHQFPSVRIAHHKPRFKNNRRFGEQRSLLFFLRTGSKNSRGSQNKFLSHTCYIGNYVI